VLANITAYNVGLFLHVAAVVVVFGATYAYPFMFAVAASGGLEATIAAAKTTEVIEKYMITPGSIFILLVGFYLVGKGDASFSDAYVGVGIAAIIVLQGMTHAFFKPRERRMRELAERDLAAGGPASAELDAVSASLAKGGQLAGFIILLTIFFMVVKP